MSKPQAQSIEQQKRLLQSLGFGFLEVPMPGAEECPEEPEPKPAVADAKPARPSSSKEKLPPPPADKVAALEVLAREASSCQLCSLHLARRHALAGGGNPDAETLFLVEMPNEEEDASGQIFEGEIGSMLADIVTKAMKYRREEVHVAFALKCRPAQGRPPRSEELAACTPYLVRQIEIVQPKIIVSFGFTGLAALRPDLARSPIQHLRGQWQTYRGIPVMPTFALAHINRQVQRKRIVWEDLKAVLARLGRG